MSTQISFLRLHADEEVLQALKGIAQGLPEHDRLVPYRASRFDLRHYDEALGEPVTITPLDDSVGKDDLIAQGSQIIDRLGPEGEVEAVLHYMDRQTEEVHLDR